MLRVDPAIPGASDRLVLPGNQRVRLFDLQRAVSRVVLKPGFSTTGMQAEVTVRGPGQSGPFPTMLAVAPDLGWFEEPRIDALPLSRQPAWHRIDSFERLALERLDRWAGPHAREVATADRLDALETRLAPFEPFALTPEHRRLVGSRLPAVRLSPTHGDAQAGNVLLTRDGEPLWIDWEFFDERVALYDRLVWGLRLRWPAGLPERVAAWVDGTDGPITAGLPRSRTWRSTIAVLVLLEDRLWRWEAWFRNAAAQKRPDLAAHDDAVARVLR